MTLDNPAAVEVAHMLSSFAANLTDAAYSIVLRHGIRGSWIDLELELWKVLALLVAQKERNTSRLRSTVEFLACREMFLSELTEAAYRTALAYGLQGSFLDVELDLDLALRKVIERCRSHTGLDFGMGASAREVADAVLERLEQQASPRARIDCCRR